MERAYGEKLNGAVALSLRALQTLWPERPCSACASWQPVEIVTFDHAPRPETCPACSRHMPIVTALEIVGVSYDAI